MRDGAEVPTEEQRGAFRVSDRAIDGIICVQARNLLNLGKILLLRSRFWPSVNKPVFLCVLWENPKTPPRHWPSAGRGRQASPLRPGRRNQGRYSCSKWPRWWQGRTSHEDTGEGRGGGGDAEADLGSFIQSCKVCCNHCSSSFWF